MLPKLYRLSVRVQVEAVVYVAADNPQQADFVAQSITAAELIATPRPIVRCDRYLWPETVTLERLENDGWADVPPIVEKHRQRPSHLSDKCAEYVALEESEEEAGREAAC